MGSNVYVERETVNSSCVELCLLCLLLIYLRSTQMVMQSPHDLRISGKLRNPPHKSKSSNTEPKCFPQHCHRVHRLWIWEAFQRSGMLQRWLSQLAQQWSVSIGTISFSLPFNPQYGKVMGRSILADMALWSMRSSSTTMTSKTKSERAQEGGRKC